MKSILPTAQNGQRDSVEANLRECPLMTQSGRHNGRSFCDLSNPSLRKETCTNNSDPLCFHSKAGRMKRRRQLRPVAINPLVVDLSHHNDVADFGKVK